MVKKHLLFIFVLLFLLNINFISGGFDYNNPYVPRLSDERGVGIITGNISWNQSLADDTYLKLDGGTVTGSVDFDDGSGNSPLLTFIAEDNLESIIYQDEAYNALGFVQDSGASGFYFSPSGFSIGGGSRVRIKESDGPQVLLENEDAVGGGLVLADSRSSFNRLLRIFNEDAIVFTPNTDTTDYFEFSTISNVPTIATTGDSNLNITASSKEITFGDNNLTTLGNLTADYVFANYFDGGDFVGDAITANTFNGLIFTDNEADFSIEASGSNQAFFDLSQDNINLDQSVSQSSNVKFNDVQTPYISKDGINNIAVFNDTLIDNGANGYHFCIARNASEGHNRLCFYNNKFENSVIYNTENNKNILISSKGDSYTRIGNDVGGAVRFGGAGSESWITADDNDLIMIVNREGDENVQEIAYRYTGTSGTRNFFNVIGNNSHMNTTFTSNNTFFLGDDIIIGDGSGQANLTMYSPDGTQFTCGVDNGGAFSCS